MTRLADYAKLVNARLDALLAENMNGVPSLLAQSMCYSVNAGGKRLRPSMLLACNEMLGGKIEDALDFACAVEMIHTYSLIHDDLPGMDNDTMRRGRPTNHVVFGEGQAILAGDGLLNYAFETMLKAKVPAEKAIAAINEIATGSGVTGMIAGQTLDLISEKEKLSGMEMLMAIQYGKTACMFIYPLRAAGRLNNATDEQLDALEKYGYAFGMLFQATDDLLDVLGNAEEVGKTLGKDAESGKLTCVSQFGVEGTRELVNKYRADAIEAISMFKDKAEFFVNLVESMVERTM